MVAAVQRLFEVPRFPLLLLAENRRPHSCTSRTQGRLPSGLSRVIRVLAEGLSPSTREEKTPCMPPWAG
jgi:hypothetical protein